MKVHEALATALLDQGVEVVFGLVGDANLALMDSYRRSGGQYVSVAHEASALLAAAGYHAVTRRLGVASVTHGPGLANATTSLIEGVKHRVPSVLITGDTPAADLDNFQDIPQRALVAATGAAFRQVRSPGTAVDDLIAAIREAAASRIPVVLNVPIEFPWQEIEVRHHPRLEVPRPVLHADRDSLERAVAVLAGARRPVLLAGRGARGARDQLVALARRIGSPLATTVQQKNFFSGDPHDLGIFGTLTEGVPLEVIAGADAVVACGASLNGHTTADGSLLAGKRLVQVDDDPAALGRFTTPTAGVLGDVGQVATDLLTILDEAQIPSSGFADERLARRLQQASVGVHEAVAARRATERRREGEGSRPAGTLDLQLVLDTVESAFPQDRTLVIDAGRFCTRAMATLSVAEPDAYVHTINFAAIGVGLPYALGASIGRPGRPTLLVCGDGGFMLGGLTEFSTAVRLGLDLVVVVVDDQSYGAEHVQLHRRGYDPTISMFDWPDFAPVAQGLGGLGLTARSIDQLDTALTLLAGRDRPALVDVRISAQETSERYG